MHLADNGLPHKNTNGKFIYFNTSLAQYNYTNTSLMFQFWNCFLKIAFKLHKKTK